MKSKNDVSIKGILKGMSRIESFSDIRSSLFAILLALMLSGIIMLIIGESPLVAYKALIKGSFGSLNAISITLSKSVPLIFIGLAVAVAFRCGLFNIGAEGQLYIGAIVSVLVALSLSNMPGIVLLPIVMLSGIIGGMVWGGFAGLLKAKFGTSEVIVTIMTNYIAILFTSYLVNGPFKAKGTIPQTEVVPESVQLTNLIPRTQLTTALLIALFTAALVYWFLWKTVWGYEIRAVGENPDAAEAGGINVLRNMIFAMALSGGLASLAGITEVLGKYDRFIENFSPGFGFTGIAVAVLGRNHPLGIILTSILFGALEAGAMRMDRVTEIPANMVTVIQGLIILLVAAPEIVRVFKRRKGDA